MSAACDTDVVVVGGGLCGLVATAALARAGRRVLLCEAAGDPGGRARTTRQYGYHLDLGPRALYRGGPLHGLLRYWRLPVSGGTPAVGRGSALYQGELHPGYASAGTLLRSRMLSTTERCQVAALLATGRQRPALARISAAEWLAGRLPTERARSAAYALLRLSTYAGSAESISADCVAAQLQLVRHGVRYLHGGWQSIVDSLRVDALAHGALIRTGARVDHVSGGAAPSVVLADGRAISARAVILAGLSPRQAGAVLDRPDLAGPAGGELRTACLDVALARLPDTRYPLVYGVDEPVYLAVYSQTCRVAPDGGAVIHVARYDDGRALPAAMVRAELEALLDRCQPGWRSLVIHQRFLPKMTTMHALPTAGAGGLAGRPDTVSPGMAGVFLAGDWVGPTSLLADAATSSALRACRASSAVLEGARA
jgi:phytoene dehydrogenase-like protein